MNYNEMSAQQCADWLAEKDGWVWRPYAGSDDQRLWTHPDGREELEYRGAERLDNEHGPYKLTLDAAAGALREPWRLRSVAYCDDRKAWQAIIELVNKQDTLWLWYAPDRMTAEYRAAVAARMEEER